MRDYDNDDAFDLALAEAHEEAVVRDAMRRTDQEIFHEAFDQEPPDEDGDRSMEQMEDMFGRKLTDAEWQRSDNTNRPVRLDSEISEREAELEEELELARAQIADYRQIYDAELAKPRQREDMERRLDAVLSNPEATAERMAQLEQQVATADHRRMNDSLGRARERDERTFDAAFDRIRRMDPNNQRHQALVREILASPDPGRALMAWHAQTSGTPVGRQSERPSHGRLPPSLSGARGGGSASGDYRGQDMGSDSDIFNAAFA